MPTRRWARSKTSSRGPARKAPEAERGLALAADGLTLARAMIAVALVPMLGTERVVPAAGLLGIAWITDYFDGIAARASGTATRLGPWDLSVDTAVGAALILGFTLWGWLPAWLGIGLVVVLVAAFVVTGNEAMSMLLQATGYGLLLWRAFVDEHRLAFGWLVGVIAVIGFANRRVFWERSLPTFLHGVAAVFRPRRSA